MVASFVGFTGFTLVMPFLALHFQALGVTDIGDVALWTGITLGVTPAWPRCARRSGAASATGSATSSWSSARCSAAWS